MDRHQYKSRLAADLRWHHEASIFGPSSSLRNANGLLYLWDGKSRRLAASAVPVVLATSVILPRRPDLEDDSDSGPLVCCEHEKDRVCNG